ncbi:uncharacterized protein [Choristoneura fumiferana]|uniref:uncharacterized protein n=1 Tax=Choristoneura fumiferana TaxID=7141 RepID=UPI003D153F9F
MRAYVTGAVCGRTLYYQYESFENYCMLDYVNCMERYEVWKVVHMGKCFVVDAFKDYEQYSYKDDYYLRHMVVKVWLPTVYNGCALSGRRHVRRKPPYENRRQWKFPRPARRPKNVTTEAPFEPQREDEENFTGTTHVDDQCSTKERAIELTTTLLRVSFTEDCDYLAFYCMRAYDTGVVCGRTLYFQYLNFRNYCLLDYVNCMERYDMWQAVHMGRCFSGSVLKEYEHYSYRDDYWLDQMYVVE